MEPQHSKKCPSVKVPAGVCKCDGYHTFDELYEHRIELYIALCKKLEEEDQMSIQENRVWRSSYHHDGSQYEGWFILGVYKEKGKQISYHIPQKKWFDCGFADTLDRAPEWDGHTSDDVLERLKTL